MYLEEVKFSFSKMKKRLSNHKGKRAANEKINKKAILIVFLVILAIIIYWLYLSDDNRDKYAGNLAQPVVLNVNNDIASGDEEPSEPETPEIVDVSYIPDTKGGYQVVGELVIDKIGFKENILFQENWKLNILDVGIARYWSENGLNEIGNYSICGHNYDKPKVREFNQLKNLVVGDTFYVVAKGNQTKVTYQIYDMYECIPEDTRCLDMPSEPVKEVTLVTCMPGAKKRLVCKAREI